MFRNFIPPVLYNAYIENRRKYGYFGEYQSWQEAKSKSDGYDSDIIIEKVKDAALKVRRGEAAFERDSVLFSKVEVAWHVLAYLLWIASLNKNVLNILDFGGSLGTTFYQNRNFLDHVELNWAIIEQSKFVEYGKKYFQDNQLKFYKDTKEYDQKPDCLILSSVLQYLESPYQTLGSLLETNPKYVLFDKTPFLKTESDKITIQKVPAHIYKASYPSWVFGLDSFLHFIKTKGYVLVSEVDLQNEKMFSLRGKTVSWKSFLFKKYE